MTVWGIDAWSFLLGYGVALLTCFFAVGLGSLISFPVSRCIKDPPCRSEHGPLMGCNVCNPSGSTDY